MAVDMGSVRRLIVATVGMAVLGFCVACSRQEAPKLEPAAAPPPPAPVPPPVVVRDAAVDVVDAASDAGAAPARAHARKAAAPPSGGGLKIEGSVSRTEGEKVVRDAQPKLRACFEASKGGAGRVSFKMTIDDRGHVTFAEIPHSTLSGGSEVESCMVRVLRDLRFPRGSGESSVSFQMSFGR